MKKKIYKFDLEYRVSIPVAIHHFSREGAEVHIEDEWCWLNVDRILEMGLEDWVAIELIGSRLTGIEEKKKEGDPCRPHLRLIK